MTVYYYTHSYIYEIKYIFVILDIQDNFSQIEILDLSQAGKLTLIEDAFKAFSNLENLNISGGGIESLNGAHFPNYNKLEHLDASWNLLETLSFDLKSKLLYLQSANFSHNAIASIEEDAWKVFQKLRYLCMDNNELKAVNFHNYPQLEVLSLSDNQIEQVCIIKESAIFNQY